MSRVRTRLGTVFAALLVTAVLVFGAADAAVGTAGAVGSVDAGTDAPISADTPSNDTSAAIHNDEPAEPIPDADVYVGDAVACAAVADDPCWQRFQDALDFADEGDTLFLLHGGVFQERAVVTTDDLTITGDRTADTGLFWQPEDAPIGDATLEIQADGVTLEEFGVDRAGHESRDADSPAAAAIIVYGDDTTFENVEVNAYVRDWEEAQIQNGPTDWIDLGGDDRPPSDEVSGIDVSGLAETVTVAETTIRGFDVGLGGDAGSTIEVTDAALTENDVGFEPPSDASATVTESAITDNAAYGILTASGDINATTNWWGEPDGPGGIGPGSGDAVSEGVEFEPWKSIPPAAVDATADPLAVTVAELPETATIEASTRGTDTVEISDIPEAWTVLNVSTDSDLATDPLAGNTSPLVVEFEAVGSHELSIEIEATESLPTLTQEIDIEAGTDEDTDATTVPIALAETTVDTSVDGNGTDELWLTVETTDAEDVVLQDIPPAVKITDVNYPDLVGEPLERYEPGDPALSMPLGFRGAHFIDIAMTTRAGYGDPAEPERYELAVEAGVAGETIDQQTFSVELIGNSVLEAYTNDEGIVTLDGVSEAIGDWAADDLTTDELRAVIDAWSTGEPVG